MSDGDIKANSNFNEMKRKEVLIPYFSVYLQICFCSHGIIHNPTAHFSKSEAMNGRYRRHILRNTHKIYLS